jgi:hypothetical protein
VSKSGLSPDWDTTLQPAVFAAPIQRDMRARLNTSLVGITGTTLEVLESQLQAPFIGTPAQWKDLAGATENDVLLTKMDPLTHITTPYMWFHKSKEDNLRYIIVDPQGIPLQHKKSLAQVIKAAQLPATLRMWLDANNPN